MMPLTQLHVDIDQRVKLIRAEYPDWLCRAGCQGCCHRLADIPQLTTAEWSLLREGLALLDDDAQQSIKQNVSALKNQHSRPVVCPLLDQASGMCRVYAYRPIACRTYGFYVQRDKGLYCKDIEDQVEQGLLDNVVWGNQDAIDQRLKGSGETRELTAWFSDNRRPGSESDPV